MRSKKSKMELSVEMEHRQSATNLLRGSEMGDRRRTNNSYVSNFDEEARSTIEIGSDRGEPALPSIKYPFYKSIPLVLLSIFKQVHLLYMIGITPFLLLKYEWVISTNMLVLQTCFTFAYICIEFISRAITYKFYTKTHIWNSCQCKVWNFSKGEWVEVREDEIKVGQVVQISPKRDSAHKDKKKVRMPVNLLPIAAASRLPSVEVDSFEVNKIEATMQVPILKEFDSYVSSNNEVSPKISLCKIELTLQNSVDQILEARVYFERSERGVQISSEDIVHRGTFFLNEDELTGVALLTMEEKKIKYLKEVLSSRNNIAMFLEKHIIMVVLVNLFLSWALIALLSLITVIDSRNTFYREFHWFFFNYFATLSFSINIIMLLIMALYQIVDSFLIGQKCDFNMNNFIKSIDEFGVADTFLMDEFTFLKKNILQVTSFEINEDPTFRSFNEEVILSIVEKSEKFQARFSNQWLSLVHHSRKKYGHSKTEVVLKDEVVDIAGSIRIVVLYQKEKFVMRFNEKVNFSVLESITLDKQLRFCEKIEQANQNGELMIMVEVLKLRHDYEMDLSMAIYDLDFTFFALIKLKFLAQSEGTEFVRYLKNKFNLVIMTSNPFEYFDKILTSAGLKNQKSAAEQVLLFEEGDEKDFQKSLRQRFFDLKRNAGANQTEMSENTALNEEPEHIREEGSIILALDASLVGYLGRFSIRELLRQISKMTTFIVFFNCSQFQKELCAASIFKIFPEHIFLSNFAVDHHIFRMSNLSIAIAGRSGGHLATATAETYKSLRKFISVESVKSIEITTIIIKTHIFKNQCLIWSLFTALILVYQGRYYEVGHEYSTYMFFLFNIGFTSFPMFYYLIARPNLIEDIAVEDLKSFKLRYEHLKGCFSGIFMTYVTFSLLPQLLMPEIFLAIMVNCTLLGNFYYLVMDDAISKKWQTLIIVLQCLFAIGIYFLTLFVQVTHALFEFPINLYPGPGLRAYFYCLMLLFNPLIILMLLLFMSIHKSIITKDMRILRRELEKEGIQTELKKEEIIGRLIKPSGMQMRFRVFDPRLPPPRQIPIEIADQ